MCTGSFLHLYISAGCRGASLCSEAPHLYLWGSLGDSTHLVHIKFQGLGTLFETRPEQSSIFKHLGRRRLLCSVWSLCALSPPTPVTHSIRGDVTQQLDDAIVEAQLPVAMGPHHAVFPGLWPCPQDT